MTDIIQHNWEVGGHVPLPEQVDLIFGDPPTTMAWTTMATPPTTGW